MFFLFRQSCGTGILPVFASWAGRPCHKGGGTGILPVFASWAGRPCHKGLQTGIA
jgi:hypothetical protein